MYTRPVNIPFTNPSRIKSRIQKALITKTKHKANNNPLNLAPQNHKVIFKKINPTPKETKIGQGLGDKRAQGDKRTIPTFSFLLTRIK